MESQPLRKRSNKGNITDRSIWPCSAVKATFHRSPSTLKMLRETKATLRMRQVRERLYSARRFTGSSCIIQAEWQLPQFASKFPVAHAELDRKLCLSVTWYVSDTLVNKAGYTANTSRRRVGRGGNVCFRTLSTRSPWTDQPTDGQTKPLIESLVRDQKRNE